MKIIYLEWIDSLFVGKWTYKDDMKDEYAAVIKSVAYFIAENKTEIKIAHSWDDTSKSWGGVLVVPKVAIKKRKWVRIY